MKTLKNFENEINRCSKCGLCQSVCPVYQQTLNDCAVSRGKFIMLRGILKGDIKFNKTVNKYLDMCLKCNACKDFCPSGINAKEIFLTAKSEYFTTVPACKFIGKFQSKKVFNSFLNLIKTAISLYRFFAFDKIVQILYPVFLNSGFLGRKVILANEFVKKSKLKHNLMLKSYGNLKNLKVIYFKGCVNKYINDKVWVSAENVLKKCGVTLIEKNFDCCGLPFLSSGNFEQFKQQAFFNLSQINEDFDYIMTDCASCKDAFLEYENVIDDTQLLAKLKNINSKFLNVTEFIIKNVESLEFKEKQTITFHKPCHLDNMDFFYDLIQNSKNVEYLEMKNFDKCCGFAGEFALKNPVLSEKISAEKIKNALETNADYILTTCPSCTLGLTQGLIKNAKSSKKLPKILNLVEFIARADKIVLKKSLKLDLESEKVSI